MKALVIGATGATGKPLIEELIKSSDYSEIVIFVRRKTGIVNQKLTEYVVDFSDIREYSETIKGDVLFC